MSSDQMTRGLEMIAAVAEKVDLHLGSRAVDLFRRIVRLSFEKGVQSGSRSRFRAPTLEFSREFVEDLPAASPWIWRDSLAAESVPSVQFGIRLSNPRKRPKRWKEAQVSRRRGA